MTVEQAIANRLGTAGVHLTSEEVGPTRQALGRIAIAGHFDTIR